MVLRRPQKQNGRLNPCSKLCIFVSFVKHSLFNRFRNVDMHCMYYIGHSKEIIVSYPLPAPPSTTAQLSLLFHYIFLIRAYSKSCRIFIVMMSLLKLKYCTLPQTLNEPQNERVLQCKKSKN